ncbi:hypothetical protein K466DRAFT_662929 [Polyporus arcularius HHB13444]|uniref:Uncharacterized protein n=1 Tax=Polyporus arcularius HHB13444 TaxID=1314778 RepID=A0A5C3PG34_9APHY|nr:hypothetical protein K466DRAFT_662929 [Polyporus arcularius HHB13444]
MSASPPALASNAVSQPEHAHVNKKVSNWTQCLDDFWIAFMEDWWGDAGQARLLSDDDIIRVKQMEVLDHFGLLVETDGKLYVREEYKMMFARLSNARKTDTPCVIPGVVLTGNPGTGKSCCAVYVLLRCLAAEQAVIFFTSKGEALYFDKEGIRTCPTADVNAASALAGMTCATPESRILSLIDSPEEAGSVSPAILSAFSFFVLFAAPGHSRYKGRLKVFGDGRLWIMKPWEVEELLTIMTTPGLMPTTDLTFNIEEVRKLRWQYGPCLRDIAEALADPVKFEEDLQDVIESLSMDSIIKLVKAASTTTSIASDRLLMVSRSIAIDPAVLRDDRDVVTFKTASVVDGIRARYKLLELQDAKRHHSACARGPHTATLAGISFEGLALMLLCHGSADFGMCAEYARMTQGSAQNAVPRRFEYHARHSGSTLRIADNRAIELVEGDTTLGFLDPCSLSSARFPDIPTPMPFIRYRYAAEADVTPGFCFVPTAPHDALFDAYFLTVTGQSVTLWIVQVAVHRTHARGLVAVKELVRRAKQRFPQVVVKYLLIAPTVGERLSVQWSMSKELSEVDGEVFVQFVYSYPALTVEDTIRPGYY